MKRSVIFVCIVAALLFLLFLLPRPSGDGRTQPASEAAPETPAATNLPPRPIEPVLGNERAPVLAETGLVSLLKGSEQEIAVRSFNATANIPVEFLGQVVDQDTNPLQHVQVGVMVAEQYMTPSLQSTGTATYLQRQTGPDGRFEVGGLKGHRVRIVELTKQGYEPELGISQFYGEYLAQSGSFTEPVVFRMWHTNMHEPLIGGNKSFVVIPDGRHYAIDLLKATMVEGEVGDLLVWIKRPESLTWGQRYDWTYELSVPEGGLRESQSRAMFRAPEAGYTNVFAHLEKADVVGSTAGFQDKCFYVLLRRNQMYGRIVISLFPGSYRDKSGLIRLSYAINPSGSRLLR